MGKTGSDSQRILVRSEVLQRYGLTADKVPPVRSGVLLAGLVGAGAPRQLGGCGARRSNTAYWRDASPQSLLARPPFSLSFQLLTLSRRLQLTSGRCRRVP